MERNTVLLRETEAFMRGELDNVTVSQNSIVLDLVQGSYVPYGCYTSAPISMPVFDALRVSWNAASPRGTAVEAQARVLVDGNWTPWVGFGKWSPYLHRESPAYQERGPVQRWPAHLQLDSKYATQAQLRIYLYSKDEKATPAVTLLGVSTHVVDVIPARGRPVNARLHLMPYAAARRTPALRPWMDLANCLASLTNRWGADLLPEEFAQVLRDWRAPDDCDPRNLGFAAAAAAQWGFPAWVAYGDLALLRAEARAGCGAVVGLQSSPEQIAAGAPERRFAAVRGFASIDGSPKVLLCDPWASENDFDCETDMPLDDFMVAWDNLALLMRQRKNNTSPLGRTRCSAWLRPVGTDAPGVYHMYINGEEHLLADDFCARGGVLAYSLPDAQPHATTAHRQFTYVEPAQGGILLEHGDTPRKYTVYAIDSAGGMLVGDVTV